MLPSWLGQLVKLHLLLCKAEYPYMAAYESI